MNLHVSLNALDANSYTILNCANYYNFKRKLKDWLYNN